MVGRSQLSQPLKVKDMRSFSTELVQDPSVPGIEFNQLLEVIWYTDGIRT